MNRKILFSIETGEEFEIQRNPWGFSVALVLGERDRRVLGNYHNIGALVDGLVELAIFSGEDAVALADVSKAINALSSSIRDYVTSHIHSPL